jgi:homoserine kinase type II
MGVQRKLNLQEAQQLFCDFNIETLTPTKDGVMDTTYLSKHYVLKYYEREMGEKILQDAKLLEKLSQAQLNTPKYLAQSKGWYLYTRLQGKTPKNTQLYHIQSLARFMAKMHQETSKHQCSTLFLEQYQLKKTLYTLKKEFFYYYKELQTLQDIKEQNDGFIHGDIFCDNTLFEGGRIAVFDFIDGACGTFSFDIAVALVAFNPHKRHSFTQLFLNTYNQKAPKKIQKKELLVQIKVAAKLYALLRIKKHKTTTKAKQLANLW